MDLQNDAKPADIVVADKPKTLAKEAARRELFEQLRTMSRIDPTTTPPEFDAFMGTCERLGLDPFSQAYLVKRFDTIARCHKASIQVGIDGFRAIAERTGSYRGQTEPEWCGPDGVWRTVWLDQKPPMAARVGVHRQGFAEPLYRVARFSSFCQTTREGRPTRMWASMPEVMISKVAEATALRAAFPSLLGGVYTPDEMGQADNAPEAVQVRQERAPAPVRALVAAETVQESYARVEARTEAVQPQQAAQVQAREWDTARQMHLGKLRDCKTEPQLRDWLARVASAQYPTAFRAVLWGCFKQHATTLGHDPGKFVPAKGEGK